MEKLFFGEGSGRAPKKVHEPKGWEFFSEDRETWSITKLAEFSMNTKLPATRPVEYPVSNPTTANGISPPPRGVLQDPPLPPPPPGAELATGAVREREGEEDTQLFLS